MAVKWRY